MKSRRGRVPNVGLIVGAKARTRTVMLALDIASDEPPTEFRIFTAGTVETVKGTFKFGPDEAAAVMAEYEAHGIDLAIDYDHASLGVGIDPALSGRAAGWFNLELRNGELWAVNVRWCPPAAEALQRKEWRFMSPAFSTDGDRIIAVMNVAITNLPATRRLQPLMAASVTTEGALMMSAETIKEALDALIAGDSEKCAELLKNIVAEAASGEPASEEPEPTPAEEAPIEVAAVPEEKTEEVVAASARLMRLTGKSSFVDCIDEVEVWRMKALKSDEALAQVAAERAILELGKRKENAIALTKLGAETPFTSGLGAGKLCKRLLDEPLDEQTARVAALLSARGGKLPEEIKPPVDAAVAAPTGKSVTLPDGRVVNLSAREVATCIEMKTDLTEYAARKPAKKG